MLETPLGCAWPRAMPHAKGAIRRIGLIAIRPNCTLGDHPKDVHFELVVHCKINGGRIVVHSKDAIRLAMPLALRPNITLGSHPKSFITENNKQTICAPLTVSARHVFRSHKLDSCRDRLLNSRRLPCSLAFHRSSCSLAMPTA